MPGVVAQGAHDRAVCVSGTPGCVCASGRRKGFTNPRLSNVTSGDILFVNRHKSAHRPDRILYIPFLDAGPKSQEG